MSAPRRYACTCRGCGVSYLGRDRQSKWCDPCREPRLCVCGCGGLVKTPGSKFMPGHHSKYMTKESRAKQGAKIRGAVNPAKRPEVRKVLSREARNNHPAYRHPEKWAKMARAMKPKNQTSKLEDSVTPQLLARGFVPQYPIGNITVDFANPRTRTIVEVQGCYWHGCSECFPRPDSVQTWQSGEDASRSRLLISHGWRVILLWEHQIEANGNIDDLLCQH